MSAKAAASASTPSLKLASLAARFPAQVMHNPVLPLLLLTEPRWFEQLPDAALTALLHVPDASATVAPALLQAALARPDAAVRQLLALHPATPAALVARLAQDAVPAVRHAARFRADAPPSADPAIGLHDALLLGLPPHTALEVPYGAEILETVQNLPNLVSAERLLCWLTPASVELVEAQPLVRDYFPFCTPVRPYVDTVRVRTDLPLGQRLALLELLQPATRIRDYEFNVSEIELLGAVVPGVFWWSESATTVPTATPDELLGWAAHSSWLYQAVAAYHPATPPVTRGQLLDTSRHKLVQQAAGASPGWTPAALRELLATPGRTPSQAFLLGLARNPQAPADVLQVVVEAHRQSGNSPSDNSGLQQVARHPNLTPDQLCTLLTTSAELPADNIIDQKVVVLAARNPAAPPALLLWLYLHYLPHLPDTAPTETLTAAPPPMQHWLPQALLPRHEGVWHRGRTRTLLPPPAEMRTLLVASPAVPAPLRQLLAEYAGPLPILSDQISEWGETELLNALATNPATPPALLAYLVADGGTPIERRQMLAAHPATPPDALQQLAAGRSLEIARLALRHPALSAPTPTDRSEPARRWRAGSPGTSPAELTQLATDKASAVRTLVAEHPATPPAALARLAQDAIGAVRARAAAHPALPAAQLATLAQDTDSLVVREVAAHPATPSALLAQLVQHPNKFVRRAAVQHPALPAEVLPTLVREKSVENRLLLLQRPEGRQALLGQLAGQSLPMAALLQLLLPAVLTEQHRAALAASPTAGHRLLVAKQPAYQAQLRHDPHQLVRAVARGELALPDFL